MDFIFEKYVSIDGHSDIEKARRSIEKIQLAHQRVQEQLEKSPGKYKTRHRVDHKFQVGDEVWLHISKERLQGEGKKMKLIRYGLFIILVNIGDSAFKLVLPSYMEIYDVVNVENLRLYEPPLIEYQGENVKIPSIEDFSPKYLDEVKQDTILYIRTRYSKRGNVDYLLVRLKGTNPSKAKWIKIGNVRELYPHLLNN